MYCYWIGHRESFAIRRITTVSETMGNWCCWQWVNHMNKQSFSVSLIVSRQQYTISSMELFKLFEGWASFFFDHCPCCCENVERCPNKYLQVNFWKFLHFMLLSRCASTSRRNCRSIQKIIEHKWKVFRGCVNECMCRNTKCSVVWMMIVQVSSMDFLNEYAYTIMLNFSDMQMTNQSDSSL